MSWNPVENPNQGIAAMRLFSQVPDKSTVKPELARVMAYAIAHIGGAKLKGSERVLEPFLNQEQEQEQEQEENTSGHSSAIPPESDDSSEGGTSPKKNSYPDGFEQAWAIYPKRSGGNSKADACKAWKARVKTGATVQELLDGTRRYADRYAGSECHFPSR